jgi:hypothetical protein
MTGVEAGISGVRKYYAKAFPIAPPVFGAPLDFMRKKVHSLTFVVKEIFWTAQVDLCWC